MKIIASVRGVPIRLTPERLEHIERRHPEMSGEEDRILETLSSPDYVQEGDAETLIAVRHYEKTPVTEKSCCVVYRELNGDDGFILTAYFASKPASWRNIVWKQ
jgi:hypothetical protein